MRSRKASLTTIFLTVFIDLMGFGILIPILPTFASKDLGISDFNIGLIVAVFSLVQFLFNPILGKLSDNIGRRPIIIVTLIITSISYLIFSVAESFIILFLSRMLAGFGGSNIAVAQAYIADITSKDERSKGMGLIGAAFGLGFVFGPIIGGLLSTYGYHVAGLGSAVLSFSAMLFALAFLPESNTVKTTSNIKIKYRLFDSSDYKKLISLPQVSLLVLLFFIIIFSFANIYGTFALLGYKVYGFSDRETAYLFGISGIVGTIVQGGFIRILSKMFKEKTLVVTGTISMMIGLGMMPYGGNFLGAAISLAILAIGTGVLQPTILSMVSKYSPDKEQGTILGMNQSLSALARVLGPVWGGFAFEFLGYEFPFLTGALFTFITLIITIFLLNPKKKVENV